MRSSTHQRAPGRSVSGKLSLLDLTVGVAALGDERASALRLGRDDLGSAVLADHLLHSLVRVVV